MASGIAVNDEIPTLYNNMKLKKTNKWALFSIKDKKEIVMEKAGDACVTNTREEDMVQFDEMKSLVTASGQPRYILYDFNFQMSGAKVGRQAEKLGFIFFCPDSAKVGDKMIYASSKDSLKKMFTGLGCEFQANELVDLDYNDFADDVEKKA